MNVRSNRDGSRSRPDHDRDDVSFSVFFFRKKTMRRRIDVDRRGGGAEEAEVHQERPPRMRATHTSMRRTTDRSCAKGLPASVWWKKARTSGVRTQGTAYPPLASACVGAPGDENAPKRQEDQP